MTPFWLRRPSLLASFVAADRDRPDLAALARIDDPEDFVWAILPHAARTFAACIALTPTRAALPCAVGYLYCRILDTYEDLVPQPEARDASLRDFAARLTTSGADIAGAPAIDAAADNDDRDRAHLLLVRQAHLVDRVFVTFDQPTREIIRDLVREMAEGMRWSSATFTAQGGVLNDGAQLTAYCGHVLGNPTVFGIRILRRAYGRSVTLTAVEHRAAMEVGEFVQLANVTRDIEKDLLRGVAYDPSLKKDLGRDASADVELHERCRVVRLRLLRRAASLAPAYARVIEAIGLPRFSIARAASVLMMLFTERYYAQCARAAGLGHTGQAAGALALISRSLLAAASPAIGRRELAGAERHLVALAST